MASKRDPQFPDITDISPLQYFHLLEQGRRPTRAQLAKLRGNNPPLGKPLKLGLPSKRKASTAVSEPKKKPKLSEDTLPLSFSEKEDEKELDFLIPAAWGWRVIGRNAFVRTEERLLEVQIVAVEESARVEFMPARYCVREGATEAWVDIRTDELLVGWQVACDRDTMEVYQVAGRPGGPVDPEEATVVSMSDFSVRKINAQRLKVCNTAEKPEIVAKIASYDAWVQRNSQVSVTIENIDQFVLQFVSVKTRKDTKTGLLLRHNVQTGKIFLYIGTKLKWERLENCEIACDLSQPPAAIKLLSSFAYESDLLRVYRAFCRKDSPEVQQSSRNELQFRKETRCAICKYILDELDYRECGKCGGCFHVQCIDEPMSVVPLRGTWRCGNCPRCENCFSEVGKFFRCGTCNSCFHEKCVDLLLAPTPAKNWKCENCAVCQFCGVRAAQHCVKWNDAVTMCHPCETKWKKREYCSICNRFWFFDGERMHEFIDPSLRLDSLNMIQCDKCQFWIHAKCDASLSAEEWSQYSRPENSKKYFCPNCTLSRRNDLMVRTVKELMALDSKEFFHHYVDDCQYNKVIKQQMCFDQMMTAAKAGEYASHPALLKDHFKLICDNAMCYYKTNASGYVTAQQLLKDGMEVVQKRLALPSPKPKAAKNCTPKAKKAKPYFERHLLGFRVPLPNSVTKPQTYDFETNRLQSLPPVAFQPPSDFFKVVILKKDIQPYLKTRDKPAFYLMGAAVEYTDPRLNTAELCYLCSSFARQEQAWVCKVCGRAFHEFCLEVEKGQRKETWHCRECRVCEICQSSGDFSSLLYCSDCGRAYDSGCLWPHLSETPAVSDWKCDNCFSCSRCGAQSFLNGHSPDAVDHISKDQDSSLCYQCFWVISNKQFCPACQADWMSPYCQEEEPREKLLCKHCGFAFHKACVDSSWRGSCASCLSKHMDFAEVEQTTIQQVQTLMELVSQINFYKSLCKDEVEKQYHLPSDLARLLSNFFLIENSEFMSTSKEIKRLFQYRGVDIIKKRSSKEAAYRTSTLPLYHGLRRSDVPSVSAPSLRVNSLADRQPVYSVSWDTSAVADILPQFWSPLHSFTIVQTAPAYISPEAGLFSYYRCVVWDFGRFLPVEIPQDFDQILHGRCNWWATETSFPSIQPDPTVEKSEESVGISCGKGAESHIEVLGSELDSLELAARFVSHEVPTAVAFTRQFEKWLRSAVVKLTLHILNRNQQKAQDQTSYAPKLPERPTIAPSLLPQKAAACSYSVSDDIVLGDVTNSLVCVFCKQEGERKLSGRLLPSEDGQWVHVNCGYWSADIEYLQECGGLLNFSQAITRGKKSKCCFCGKHGATLLCSSKKCHSHYHFPCAALAGVRFYEPKTVLCKDCAGTKDTAGKSPLDADSLSRLTNRKWTFTTGKRYARKPPFLRNAFNRIGSLILCEIPEKGVHEQLHSLRLTWKDGRRALFCCSKRDSLFRVTVAESGALIAVSEVIEDLWPTLKLGESFYLRSAADFFGYSSIGNYLPPGPEVASYMRSLKEKKPKTLQEVLNSLRSPPSGASVFLPYDKHRLKLPARTKSRNTKSTHFEDSEVGHRKDDLTLVSEYRKYKKSQNRDEQLEVTSSVIHGLGLFTTVEFLPGNLVVEYIGEVVRNRVADKREKEYEAKGIGQGSCYMFRLDEDFIVDATVKGGKARFINHSCQPNCEATVCEIDGEKHILLFAKRRIYRGEEITYDYHFEVEADKISCACGCKDCQGKLN